jgi:hypothetical protein
MSREAACVATHPQILSGICPWCGTPIGEQPSVAEPQSGSPGERRWDMARMKSDLDHEDRGVPLITIQNVRLHCPNAPEAVDVLRIGLSNSVERVREAATIGLALLGRSLAAGAVEEHEAASRWHPDDLAVRILLLGYYSGRQFESDAARITRQAHVLWVIEHVPTSHIAQTAFAGLDRHRDGAAYERGVQLWMAQVAAQPDDTSILGNAARFLTNNDKVKCGELLRRARSLEPDIPEWSNRLGHLYSLEMIGKDTAARRDWAAMTQAEYERGQGLYRDERERLRQLPRLAEAAFEAGDYSKAHAYASELLSKADSGHKGLAVFYGNQVLGRLALAEGDVERANGLLLASAETTGSPTLCSFGPSMVLARELLRRGERDVVLRYLERCSSFWAYGAEWLARWASTIERGETPDFRAYKK